VIGFPAAPRQIDRTASLVALLLVATVTEAMFLLLPSFVGALGDVLHLSATRTGLLASADLTGIALTTATAPWWLRRVSWRRTVLASLLAFLLINLVCFAVRSFWPLLCLRVLAGLSAGAAYPIALAGVLDTTRAPRNTGLMMSLQVVFGAAGVYAIDAVRLVNRRSLIHAAVVVRRHRGQRLLCVFSGGDWARSSGARRASHCPAGASMSLSRCS